MLEPVRPLNAPVLIPLPENWPDWLPPWDSLRREDQVRFIAFLERRPWWWTPPPHLWDRLRDLQQWRTIPIALTSGRLDGGPHQYVTRWPWERICEAIGEPPEIHAVDDGDGRIYGRLRHHALDQTAKHCGVAGNSILCGPSQLAAASQQDYDARTDYLDCKSDCSLFGLDISKYPVIVDPKSGELVPARRSRGIQLVIRTLLKEHDAKRHGIISEGGK